MSSFFFQAEDGIRDLTVTGVQTCALPIYHRLHGKQAWGIVVDRRLRLQGGGKHPQERQQVDGGERYQRAVCDESDRSEEHTSELQSQSNLVCRLLLERKNPSHYDSP